MVGWHLQAILQCAGTINDEELSVLRSVVLVRQRSGVEFVDDRTMDTIAVWSVRWEVVGRSVNGRERAGTVVAANATMELFSIAVLPGQQRLQLVRVWERAVEELPVGATILEGPHPNAVNLLEAARLSGKVQRLTPVTLYIHSADEVRLDL